MGWCTCSTIGVAGRILSILGDNQVGGSSAATGPLYRIRLGQCWEVPMQGNILQRKLLCKLAVGTIC